jgi:hypothetical protein
MLKIKTNRSCFELFWAIQCTTIESKWKWKFCYWLFQVLSCDSNANSIQLNWHLKLLIMWYFEQHCSVISAKTLIFRTLAWNSSQCDPFLVSFVFGVHLYSRQCSTEAHASWVTPLYLLPAWKEESSVICLVWLRTVPLCKWNVGSDKRHVTAWNSLNCTH